MTDNVVSPLASIDDTYDEDDYHQKYDPNEPGESTTMIGCERGKRLQVNGPRGVNKKFVWTLRRSV